MFKIGKKTINCPYCGKKILSHYKFCKFCGKELSTESGFGFKGKTKTRFDKVEKLLENQDVSGALKILEEILNEDPNSIDALGYCGLIYSGTGRHQEAIDVLNKMLSIEPENPQIWLNTAINYKKLNEYQKAIDAANTCLKYDPKNCDALVIVGNTLRILKQYQFAIDCYQKALRINNRHALAFQNYNSIIDEIDNEDIKREQGEFVIEVVFEVTPITIPSWKGGGLKFYKFGGVNQKFGEMMEKVDIFVQFNKIPLESVNIFVNNKEMILSVEEYPDAFKAFQKIFKVEPIKLQRVENPG